MLPWIVGAALLSHFAFAGHLVTSTTAPKTISLASKLQVALAPHSEFETAPVSKLQKGTVRVLVPKAAKLDPIHGENIEFSSKVGEFELSESKEAYVLNVLKGEVLISSPEINSFVPLIVKAGEGFRFNRLDKSFKTQKLELKFPKFAGFVQKKKI